MTPPNAPVAPVPSAPPQGGGIPTEMLIKKSTRNKAPEAPPAKPSEAEEAALAEIKDKLPSLLFDDAPKPKVEEKPKPAEPEVPAAPVAEAPPAEEPAVAKKKTVVRKQVDPMEVARFTAEQTAKVIADRISPPTPDAPVAPADPAQLLSPEDRENYDVFKYLSESEPAKYKDADKRFLSFVDKLAAYKRKWVKANPGQAFNPEDTEHEDFYSASQPSYSETDLDRAKIRMEATREVERKFETERKRFEDRLSEVESKAISGEVQREAAETASAVTQQLVGSLADAQVKAKLEEGVDALRESDPVAFDVIDAEAASLQQRVVELHNITRRPKYFNPSNPVHNYLAGFVEHQERLIAGLPASQQVYEGKSFAPREQYAQMSPTDRRRHWTLGEDDIVHMLTQVASNRVNTAIVSERQRVEDTAKRYGFVKGVASLPPKAASASAPSATKPKAPSSGDGGATAPAGTPAPVADEPIEKKLVSSLF